MSGIMAAMVGGGTQVVLSVAVTGINDGAGNTYGFGNGDSAFGTTIFGTCSPSSIKGATIGKVTSFTAGAFQLAIAGTLARTFIQGITLQRSTGAISYLNQQDATFSANGTYAGFTFWSWADTGWTANATRLVMVRY